MSTPKQVWTMYAVKGPDGRFLASDTFGQHWSEYPEYADWWGVLSAAEARLPTNPAFASEVVTVTFEA